MADREVLFAPGGLAYITLPRVPLMRAASDVLAGVLSWARAGAASVTVTDRQIAESLAALGKPHSLRFVQKGLKQLQEVGLIARTRVERPTRWGLEVVRQITLKFRLAQSGRRVEKSKKGNGLGAKKFGPPCAQGGAAPTPPGAVLLMSREQDEENNAAAADAGRGSPSSSAAEAEPEPRSPDEAKALMEAAIAANRALVERSRASPSPRAVPPAARPLARRDKPPRAPELTDEKLAEMAAHGDRAAQIELNERHRREVEAAARADPSPSEPPDAYLGPSGAMVDHPPSAKARRSFLGRLLGRD